jgi:carbonic anhydrase/acetyltransferase-like protein (isoleucine patch superfamily)
VRTPGGKGRAGLLFTPPAGLSFLPSIREGRKTKEIHKIPGILSNNREGYSWQLSGAFFIPPVLPVVGYWTLIREWKNMIRSLNGKTPIIAKSAFISETAYIVGDVEIGENTSVWPGAVIRGDFGKITIGRNTAIEDNVVVHCGSSTSPDGDVDIGNDVIIGHGAVLNCRRVGNNILIGINAAILHDAEIGDNSVIAAGCVVGNGMKVP